MVHNADVASAVEAFGRRSQPAALSVVEVVVLCLASIVSPAIFIYRKRHGLAVGRQNRIDPAAHQADR